MKFGKTGNLRFWIVLLGVALLIVVSMPQGLGAPPETDVPGGLEWGDPSRGLQMAVRVDPKTWVVSGWIRNAESQWITYNSYMLGNWEFVGIEVRDGKDSWKALQRAPYSFRAYLNAGPSEAEKQLLSPHELITGEAFYRRAEMAEDEYSCRAIIFPLIFSAPHLHIWEELNRRDDFPPPVPRGPTIDVDLADFIYPADLLRQGSFEVRVVQQLAGPGMMPSTAKKKPLDFSSDSIVSPVFKLDGPSIKALVEAYRIRMNRSFNRQFLDGTTIQLDKSSVQEVDKAGKTTLNESFRLHAIEPDQRDVEVWTKTKVLVDPPNWFEVGYTQDDICVYDAIEQSGWISVLYQGEAKDLKDSPPISVDTFRIRDGKVAGLHTTLFEPEGTGILRLLGFKTREGKLSMICDRTDYAGKSPMHDELEFSIKDGEPVWSEVGDR